jgi:hypothetical protein
VAVLSAAIRSLRRGGSVQRWHGGFLRRKKGLNGAAFKTFMGGGMNLAMAPDIMADNFLKSIARDIVERFDSTNKENLRDSLKSRLFLTDTKCNIPKPLQEEVGEKQITLGQFMMKDQH